MLIGTEILDTKARDRLKLFLSENLDVKLVISSSWRFVGCQDDKREVQHILYSIQNVDSRRKA